MKIWIIKKWIILMAAIACMIMATTPARAQFIEDAVRISQSAYFQTARTAALGVAFYGISDDFGALMYNPAGLTNVVQNELSLGFGFTSLTPQVGGLFTGQNVSANSEYLTHLGMVVPFKTHSGNAAIGFGYVMEDNYKNNLSGSYFNPYSSYINYTAQHGPAGISDNMATYLLLADTLTFYTPIRDSVLQHFDTQESGGMNDLIGGAAFDITPNLSLGLTVVGKWGSYAYNRNYTETDIYNKYNFFDPVNFSNVDFNMLQLSQQYTQTISGITGSVGIMGRIKDFMKLSATVKFPTVYNIDEEFSESAIAQFDNGYVTSPPWTNPSNGGVQQYSYKLTTPFKYSLGASFNMFNLTLAAAVEYSDATQMEFSDAPQDILNTNFDITRDLVGQTTWGVGAEYEIPSLPVDVRAGISQTSTPYQLNIPDATLTNIAFGAGVYLAPNVRLDAVYKHSSISNKRVNYGTDADYSFYTYDMKPTMIAFQITYRY